MNRYEASRYDLIANGLGDMSYQEFVDTYLNSTQSGRKTPGFEWDPDMQIDFSYAQIEAELGLYTMATYVDIDSPGLFKHVEGAQLGTGKIPRFKHGFALNEKILREEMIIYKRTGRFSSNFAARMMMLMFDNTQKLIMGNYSNLTYQRDQMVSQGEFTLTTENNPGGLTGITFKANVPAANKTTLSGTKRWYYATSSEGADSDPINDLKDMVKKLKRKGVSGYHFEVDSETFDKFAALSKVKNAVVANLYPMADGTQAATIAAGLADETIQEVVGKIVKAPIRIIDNIVAVEKYNQATGKVDSNQIRSFASDVWVLVPDGSLGSIKAVEPIVVDDPAARIAYYDGGRTVLKQTFDTHTNTQNIMSELTALVVPDKPKYMLYLTVTSAA